MYTDIATVSEYVFHAFQSAMGEEQTPLDDLGSASMTWIGAWTHIGDNFLDLADRKWDEIAQACESIYAITDGRDPMWNDLPETEKLAWQAAARQFATLYVAEPGDEMAGLDEMIVGWRQWTLNKLYPQQAGVQNGQVSIGSSEESGRRVQRGDEGGQEEVLVSPEGENRTDGPLDGELSDQAAMSSSGHGDRG